jgi:hypothetical protein
MEGIPDRRGKRLFTERLHVTVSADSADLALRASGARATGRRQGCQRFGGAGSERKNTPPNNPGLPAEADRAS